MACSEKIDTATDKTQLASQEKIETLYYKAVWDAKLDDVQNETRLAIGPPGYSTDHFRRWARTIDISTLGEGAADFSTKQDEQIVKEFGAFRHKVVNKLSEEFTYDNLPLHGHLRDIGSC